MGNLLLDIVNYLITQGVVTADGTDVFRDNMPDNPDNLVSVFEGQGVPAFVCDAENRSIQVSVRNTSYIACKTKIRSIFTLFHSNETEGRYINFTATRWGLVGCRGTPFKLKEDESKRTIFVFNMSIITHKD